MTTQEHAEFPDSDAAKKTNGKGQRPAESPNIRRANKEVKVYDVCTWLGLVVGDTLRCPAETDEDRANNDPHYGVNWLNNSIKCHHNRCSTLGDGPCTGADGEGGYRSNVALVAEVRGVDRETAARLILEQFGLITRVSVELLKHFATWLKRNKKNNRLVALGVELTKICEKKKIELAALEQLTHEIGAKFHDCDAQSIAEHFKDSIVDLGKTEDDVKALIEAAQKRFTASLNDGDGHGAAKGENLGAIYVTVVVDEMADKAESVLSKLGGFFQHGTELARIVKIEKPAKRIKVELPTPMLQEPPYAAIREAVGKAFWFVRNEDGDEKRVLPPDYAITALQARTNWPLLPNVETVAECPVMRRDGSIVTQPGYDEISGTFLIPNADYPPIPENPTPEQVRAAIAAIDDVFVDVPWEKPEHRSAAFAAILTLVARDTFEGPAPCFVIEASKAGSGKDQLARLISIIGTGTMPFSSQFTEDQPEQRKALTSIAMAGARVVLYGNVVTDLANGQGFGGAALCDALTTTKWSDRVLGMSKNWSGELKTVFFATANNMLIAEDMGRRVCPIRLDWSTQGIGKPHELPADFFKHPDVIGYALANRPKLVVAAITIMRWYFAAGCPKQATSSWGSFPGWERVILGALVFAGFPDPTPARKQFQDRADFGENLRARFVKGLLWLFEVILKNEPALASTILEHIRDKKESPPSDPTKTLWHGFGNAEQYANLTEALQGLLLPDGAERTISHASSGRVEQKPQLPSSKQVGRLLAKLDGVPFDITPRIAAPNPPKALVDAVATVDGQEFPGSGTKWLDGTMIWTEPGNAVLGIPSKEWQRNPDGSTLFWDPDEEEWIDEWQCSSPDYAKGTYWRDTYDPLEMWSDEEDGWVPQPRVIIRVKSVEQDRNGTWLWRAERLPYENKP